MTYKKASYERNVLAKTCRDLTKPTGFAYIFGRGCKNTQTSRGPPRKQYEDGVEVPLHLLKRVIGTGGSTMKKIREKYSCMIKVFKEKTRTTPLVWVLAFNKGNLESALHAIRYHMNLVPEPKISLTMPIAWECVMDCDVDTIVRNNAPYVTAELDDSKSYVTFSGPRRYVLMAKGELKVATPQPIVKRVQGPKGLLIGAFGANVGHCREHFCVNVDIKGDEAIIVGTPGCVIGAVQWYEDLVRTQKSYKKESRATQQQRGKFNRSPRAV